MHKNDYPGTWESSRWSICEETEERDIPDTGGADGVEPIHEQQFQGFSYGFRPGKSQHMALDRLWQEAMNMRGACVIDLDISRYFDTIDHQLLREVVQKRVRDGVITRMIGTWLHAGVMEGGTVTYPKAGSPQGRLMSPLLSHINLHEILDEGFIQEMKPRMRGKQRRFGLPAVPA